MLPYFIIIGAMKSGTTSLYHYLASHPSITPSSIKEPAFFIEGKNYTQGLDWYEALFDGDGSYAFEATTSYTKRHIFPGVPARMHSILPDVKLIYVLRDPIERAISHYVHNYAHGRESKSFSEALRNTSRNYIETSKYHFQIQAYLDYYSEDQLFLVQSEQLRENPEKTVEEIFGFLEIFPNYDPEVLKKQFHQSKQKERRSALEREILRRTTNPYLKTIVQRITKPLRKSFERPNLSEADRELLIAEIAPDVENLRAYSGLEFSDWSL